MNIEAGTVGIRVRCAAHNHVFEIYTSYTHNGEVVIDLVPCPQCRDHMDNEILPLKPEVLLYCGHPASSLVKLAFGQLPYCEDCKRLSYDALICKNCGTAHHEMVSCPGTWINRKDK